MLRSGLRLPVTYFRGKPATLRSFQRFQHASAMLKEFEEVGAKKEASEYSLPNLFPEQLSLNLKMDYNPSKEVTESVNNVQHMKALSPSAVEENVALLDAHLRVGNVSLAKRMFFQLWRRNPASMALYTNTGLLNRFIEVSVLNLEPQISQAEEFFGIFEELRAKCSTLVRNLDTYTHMAHGYMRQGSQEELGKLIALFEKEMNMPANKLMLHAADLYPESAHSLSNSVKSLGYTVPLESEISDYISGSQAEKNGAATQPLNADETFSLDELEKLSPDVLTPSKKNGDAEGDVLLPVQAPGVTSMRSALSIMANDQISLYEQQQLLEEEGYRLAVEELEVLKKETKNLPSMTIPKQLVLQWHEALVKEFDARRSTLGGAGKSFVEESQRGHVLFGDKVNSEIEHSHIFLSLIDPAKASLITITEILRSHGIISGTVEVRTASLFKSIGASLEKEYQNELHKSRRRQRIRAERQKMATWSLVQSGNNAVDPAVRKYARGVELQSEKENVSWTPRWPDTVQIRLGAMLCDMAIAVCKMPGTEEAAFRHETTVVRGRKYGVIRYHLTLTQILSREPLRESLTPRMLPMLVAPRPWLTWRSGGYLDSRTDCIRIRGNREHRDYMREADERGHLTLVLQALDVLGKTAWRVNERMFPVVRAMWNSGEPFAEIPGIAKIPPPEKPADMESNPESARKFWKSYYDWSNQVQACYSQRCDANYKVEIAQSFLGKRMYFPHNLDFRGRAYPMPPHLNHIGNDLCRGLLLFDEAKPLGEKGLWWLYVQIANVFGVDKITFEERVAFVKDNLEAVLDSARNPLKGQLWWHKAASPWQCLAACMELEAALHLEDPTKYLSRLPIHQDGTCNGLQHFAALGGDIKGAAQVNLLPSGSPQDVYSGVADVVRRRVEKEAETGNPEARKILGKITRKLVKQTVMTNTYGVTLIGAKAQVFQRLKEMKQDLLLKKLPLDDFMADDDEMKRIAGYVTKHTFAALGELFHGAREIQNWLNIAASLISKSIPKSELSSLDIALGDYFNEMGFFADNSSAILEAEEAGVDATAKDAFVGVRDVANGTDESATADDWYVEDDLDATRIVKESKKGSDKAASKKNDAFKKNRMTSVTWTTPLGLPIVQPYRLQYIKSVQTSLQVVNVLDPTLLGPVNARKQSTAFPPNFIHSLDASHMMLSAITCQRHGLTFAAVHDSYWTHASDIDRMSEILRECFIKLHSENIMERLLKEFQYRYGDRRVPAIVQLSSEDLEKAKNFVSQHHGRASKIFRKVPNMKNMYSVRTFAPLRFPTLPQRGEFDVSLVKSSSYFFH